MEDCLPDSIPGLDNDEIAYFTVRGKTRELGFVYRTKT